MENSFNTFFLCFRRVFSVLLLKYCFLFFPPEPILPPSDFDNDIQGMVTIPLAGPDLVS